MRYRDLLVATLSGAICEMQARSTTLFGFVTDIERRQSATEIRPSMATMASALALPSRAASIQIGGRPQPPPPHSPYDGQRT